MHLVSKIKITCSLQNFDHIHACSFEYSLYCSLDMSSHFHFYSFFFCLKNLWWHASMLWGLQCVLSWGVYKKHHCFHIAFWDMVLKLYWSGCWNVIRGMLILIFIILASMNWKSWSLGIVIPSISSTNRLLSLLLL